MENILGIMFIISAVFFVIQSAMGFIGLDADLDMPDDSSFGFFTIRNLNAFILGFSSAGYLLLKKGYSPAFALAAGTAFGLFLIGTTFYGMRLMHKLQQENKTEAHNYIGLSGTVSLKVPLKRSGTGKVSFNLNGRFEEMPAVTDGEEEIPKGAAVVISKRLDNNTLLVNKKII